MNRLLDSLERTPRRIVLLAASGLLVALTWIDFATGPDVSFLVFYLVPLYLTAWYVGRPAALLFGSACAVAWLLPRGMLDPARHVYWNLAVHVAFFLVVGQLLHGLRRSHDRRIDERIQLEHERMAIVLGLLPEGVALVSRDGAVLVHNDSALRMAHAQRAGTVQDLALRHGVATRLEPAGSASVEFEAEWEGRTFVHVLARRSTEDPTAGVLRDVTEERTLLAHSIHESKMADLGLLAAGIAHEIGNPLSSISAILQLVALDPLSTGLAERVSSIEGHLRRMDRIVKTVIGFARQSGRDRADVHAGRIVDRAVEIFHFHERSKGIVLETSELRRDLRVSVVEDEIVQILLNLLLNAVDALGGTGTIRVSSRESGGEVHLAIRDEGTGMGPETLRRIFTPFFTTKEPGRGTGLGLAVSQALVAANDGRIEVQSAPGTGSVFTICLAGGASRRADLD